MVNPLLIRLIREPTPHSLARPKTRQRRQDNPISETAEAMSEEEEGVGQSAK